MEPTSERYKDHTIEVRFRGAPGEPARAGGQAAASAEPEAELLIDDETVEYDRFSDGQYFLHEYAYDWTDDLLELARRFIDYRDRSDEIRRRQEPGTGSR